MTTPHQKLKSLFARYMKEPDKSKAHAVLSASGSERWLNCPGSIRLSKDIPNEDSGESAIAGTNAHTLLQFILENKNWKQLLAQPESKRFKKFIDYSDEQLACVMVAVNYVALRQSKLSTAELFVEQKLELEGVGFGTSDVVLYQPFGILHVMDYKNGRGKVEAENNTQMLYYAHAAADKFGWDFKEVWITVIQPNAHHKDGPIRTWMTDIETLEKAGSRFRKGAALTKKKDAPLVSDPKWCWFCPARENKCPEQMKRKQEKVMERFER